MYDNILISLKKKLPRERTQIATLTKKKHSFWFGVFHAPGKVAGVCRGVCRTSAFNICFALTFAEARHLTPVIPWRLPKLGI
ncbi:hypothetical protein JHU38_10460 [Prevotella sp. A2931]|uniref:Uncharacterized protein n=1 Tax=Prevotella illustrans TaxID=2800387 RepID=A0ABS3M7J9_9BACT|nr:hypothetical protein [Prevotella sp. oral taxon 820]MBO1364181.1 hypothetical protein [Prevotella illustrans]